MVQTAPQKEQWSAPFEEHAVQSLLLAKKNASVNYYEIYQ